jgi:hypothetical protein
MERSGGPLEELLAKAGVCLPPIPLALQRQLKERAAGYFSTRSSKAPPSQLMHFVRKAMEGALPDFVLIARAADGLPAPALHYYLILAPLQLFLQLQWPAEIGGERRAATIDECFRLSQQLVQLLPMALRRGRLSADGRLTVVGSDFGEGFWEVSMSGERAARPGRTAARGSRNKPRPQEVLAEAVRWCKDDGSARGEARNRAAGTSAHAQGRTEGKRRT